jgi:hypothetical protein
MGGVEEGSLENGTDTSRSDSDGDVVDETDVGKTEQVDGSGETAGVDINVAV